MCFFGACVCEPACDGKDCGPDSCGWTCGSCGPGKACIEGQCPPAGMECDDGNSADWDGCTDGELSEFLVTDTGPTNKFDIATLSDGGFGIVWDEGGDWISGNDIYFNWYDASGISTFGPLKANEFDCEKPNSMIPAIVGGGSFFFIWRSITGSTGCLLLDVGWTAILGKVLSETSVGEWQIVSSQYGSLYNPDAARLSNENIATAWSLSGQNQGIYARLLDSDGSALSQQVKANTSQSAGTPVIEGLNNGKFVVVWGPVQGSLLGQFFTASGGKEGGEIGFGLGSEHRVASFTNGSIIIVSNSYNDDNGYDVHGQVFNSFGFSEGPAFVVGDDPTAQQMNADVAVFSDDSFVIVWDGEENSEGGIHFQRYDADGSLVGNQITANVYESGHVGSPRVEAFVDDSFIITWQSTGGDGLGILARRFHHDGSPIYH